MNNDIEKGNYIISTLSSKDISALYNMRVLNCQVGRPNAIIQECFNQIKTELASGNIENEVHIILKFGFQSSVSIQILNPLRQISKYLENKNVISNFTVIKTEKLDKSEIQLITLLG